jgi:hypothetical protein
LRNNLIYITLAIEKSKNQVSIRGFKMYRYFNYESDFLPEGEWIKPAIFGDFLQPIIILFDVSYYFPDKGRVYIVFTTGKPPLAFGGMINL